MAKNKQSQQLAIFEYEQIEFKRIERLASSGAVQSELLDAARIKLKATEAANQSYEVKVATANANLAGGRAAVRRAQADAANSSARIEVAQANLDTWPK